MDKIEIEEQENHSKEYFDQLGLDIKRLLKSKKASMYKQAKLPSITIPDIEGSQGNEEEIDSKPPIVPDMGSNLNIPDIGPDIGQDDSIGNIDDIEDDIEDIKDSLTDIKFNSKLDQIQEDMRHEFESTINNLQTELNELKDRKIPEAKQFDNGGLYRESVFEIVTRVLDDVLISLFDDVPDYSLISSQISRTYEDGTVSDAIVAVSVTVPNEGYRYDFKIDVPILNGIIQYPTYIQRGLKVIPLTKEKVLEELDTLAFRKLDVEEARPNNFSNVGINVHKRPDMQKWYEISGNGSPISSVPGTSKWDSRMDKRR